jgi:hypothetical protein
MPLQKTTAAVSLHDGLETKTDPKQVVAGKMLALSNGVFTSPGKIGKRNGTAARGSVLANSQGRFLAQYSNETLTGDGRSLYSWDTAATAWVNRGAYQSIGVSRSTVNRTRAGMFYSSQAVNNGLICTVYQGTTSAAVGLFYTVKDQATGAVIVSDALVESTLGAGPFVVPRVLPLGSSFLFVYCAGGNLVSRSITTAAPASVSGQTVINALSGGLFDAVVNPSTGRVYVSWADSTHVQCGYFAVPGTYVSGGAQTPAAPPTSIGMFADRNNGNVVVCWRQNDNNLLYWGVTAALGNAWTQTNFGSSAVAVFSFTGYSGANLGQLYWSPSADASVTYRTWNINTCTFNGATPGSISTLAPGVMLASKPFNYDGVVYMLGQYTNYSTLLNSPTTIAPYFLIDQFGNVCARVGQEDGLAGIAIVIPGGSPFNISLQEASVLPSGSLLFSLTVATAAYQDSVYSISSTYYTAGIDLLTLDMANTSAGYQNAQIANSIFLSGGMLYGYDGTSITEAGFHYPPWYLILTAPAGGDGGLSIGQYQWAVTYEWTDNQGQVWRSAPTYSNATANAGANNSTTLTFPTLRLTAKTGVVIRIYRTLVNGSVFYLVNQVTPVLNDSTVVTLAYKDTKTDANIASQVLLYTQQQVPAVPGPPCSALAVYRNRLMLVASEQPLQLWYSLQVIPGQPAQMSDQLIQNIDSVGGPMTALGVMDDKLMISKSASWLYMSGNGPDALGNNSDFSTPITIDATSGCTVPDSIVMADKGLMYQSGKGLWMIDRGLQEHYVGEGIEGLLTSNIVGAGVIPYTNEVRFELASGVTLVWDYFLSQWSSFSYPYGTHGAAAVVNGVWSFITAAGQVYQETPGTYSDNGAVISTSFTTSWLQLASLQGFQRVYKLLVLGDYYSAHTLVVQFAVDFDPTIVQTDVVTAASPEQFRFFMSRQKCQAMQVTITDNPAVAGRSMSISGLTFEVGVKGGPFRLPASQSFG